LAQLLPTPAFLVHEVTRAEKNRTQYFPSLRVVIVAVLSVAADAVLAAHRLQKLGAHLATALALLHVQNLARRSGLEVRSMRDLKNGGEGWINLRNSMW
jgi:hypothetical protein